LFARDLFAHVIITNSAPAPLSILLAATSRLQARKHRRA
jgi:hypothetical protein